jgi:hypothetical protein
LLSATHLVTLTLWIAAIVSGGVAAAGAFATLPDLEITLDEFSGFAPADSQTHGRIAAGKMLEPIFASLDLAQVPLAGVCILTLLFGRFLVGPGARSLANRLRTGAVITAGLLLVVHLALIAPPMNRELRFFWSAAAAGNETAARMHRAAFDGQHPRATLIAQANLALLLTALIAGAWASATPGSSAEGLEPPLLARRPAP